MSEAQSQPPQPRPAAKWAPPKTEPGDTVLWYRDRSANCRNGPGTVIASYGNMVDIVLTGNRQGIAAVRHWDDPHLDGRPEIVQESGCWVLAGDAKRIRELSLRLDAMEKFLDKVFAAERGTAPAPYAPTLGPLAGHCPPSLDQQLAGVAHPAAETLGRPPADPPLVTKRRPGRPRKVK